MNLSLPSSFLRAFYLFSYTLTFLLTFGLRSLGPFSDTCSNICAFHRRSSLTLSQRDDREGFENQIVIGSGFFLRKGMEASGLNEDQQLDVQKLVVALQRGNATMLLSKSATADF